ncbi:MAG: FHA domain-containing protein, partial [Vicinamibacterales bacterium]
GRSKDNDVVLEDPGKGVSRTHAELRPEGDRYRLVDLESQNGIWVSGERVPSVVLAPGVVAVMGPFRVALNAASPLTQPFTVLTPDSAADTGTEISRPIPPAPPADQVAVAVDGPGGLLDDPSPPTDRPPVTPPPVDNRAPAVKKGSVAPRPDEPKRPTPGGNRSLWAIAAVALIAASAFGAYKLVYKPKPKPVWDAAAAMTLANDGRCQEALDLQINPALQADPNNAEAQSLKQKCTAPPPTTSVPPGPVDVPVVAKTNAQKLDEADTALAANECQVALDTATGVVTEDPNDERGKGLIAKATACLNPVPGPTAVKPAADSPVRIAPGDGGLEPLPAESGKDYKARVAAMRKRYDDAVTLLQGQRYAQALRELENIAAAVPVGYRELAQRRGEARNAIRDEAVKAYNAGKAAEQRSEWNVAIERYQRAHDLDPAQDVSGDIARINDQKLKAGAQLCNEGRALFSLGKNADAAPKLTRALELLPTDHECYIAAKRDLALIGR